MGFKFLFFVLALFVFKFDNDNSTQNTNSVVGPDSAKIFELSRFEENIRKTLDGKTMGYGFVLYDGVRDYPAFNVARGWKRVAADGGNLKFDLTSRIHIASMSKTLSAIATLQLLKKDNLTTYDKLVDFLPRWWKTGPNADQITLRDIMQHMSGIRNEGEKNCDGESFRELRCVTERGVNPDSMGVYSYQNMNFAMLRVAIPKLEGYDHAEKNDDSLTAFRYIDYVNNNIIRTAGAEEVGFCRPTPDDYQYYYKWPYEPKSKGQRFYDYSLKTGAYGSYISVEDYGKIIYKLFNSEEILDSAWRDTLVTNHLGCYTYKGKHGGYIWHNGEWTWTDKSGSGQMNSCWMYFPNGVIAVAMVNSNIPEWFPDILAHAYDNAWIPPRKM